MVGGAFQVGLNRADGGLNDTNRAPEQWGSTAPQVVPIEANIHHRDQRAGRPTESSTVSTATETTAELVQRATLSALGTRSIATFEATNKNDDATAGVFMANAVLIEELVAALRAAAAERDQHAAVIAEAELISRTSGSHTVGRATTYWPNGFRRA
jgi:hypothetical protein